MLFDNRGAAKDTVASFSADLVKVAPELSLSRLLEEKIAAVRPEWLRVFSIVLNENSVGSAPVVVFYALTNRKITDDEREQWRARLTDLLDPIQVSRINIYHRPESEGNQDRVEQRREFLIRRESLNTGALAEDAQVSLPGGVVLLNVSRYQISLKKVDCEFVVFKCYVPVEKEQALTHWIEAFEDRHGIDVVIERERNYLGVQPLLKELAGQGSLLTSQHLPRISGILGSFYGHCPEGLGVSNLSTGYPDMTDIPFIAIDPPGTVDIEDALYAERLPNGGIRHLVAITDITTMVTPGSPLDRYASKLGASIYGQRKVIPTLGDKVCFNLASFLPEQERMAWISERTIGPDGSIDGIKEPYLARICVRDFLCPQDLATAMTDGHPCAGVVKALAQAGGSLRQARLNKKPMMRISQQGSVELVVGESMIAANCAIADFLARHRQCPAIFKVHATPSPDLRERLAQRVSAYGVPVVAEHFEDPLQFVGIIKALQARSFWYQSGTAEHNLVVNLLNEIVDRFLMKSSFDLQPAGHHALAVPVYCSIKARTAVGIANQMQVRSCIDASYKMIAREGMDRRIKLANRQSRAYGWKVASLRTFETLEQHLSESCEYPATIREIKPDSLVLEVPTFKRWGLASRLNGDEPFEVGQVIMVKLLGFDVGKMRFKFSMVSEV